VVLKASSVLKHWLTARAAMQTPADAKREGELSGRIYYVRERRDANHEDARNKKSPGGLGGCMAALAVKRGCSAKGGC
jgi:hypothetical protein